MPLHPRALETLFSIGRELERAAVVSRFLTLKFLESLIASSSLLDDYEIKRERALITVYSFGPERLRSTGYRDGAVCTRKRVDCF